MLLMAAQTCGGGSRAERAATGSIDRVKFERAKMYMKFKHSTCTGG